jgi:hypothetical protein
MSWARIDDNITFHRKVVHAGNEAFGAWMRMIAWSANHLTDGNIPRRIGVLIAEKEKVLDVLVECELLERNDDDFVIHDYHEHNPKAEVVKAKRRAEADRKAVGRKNQGRDESGKVSARNPSGQRADVHTESDGNPRGIRNDVHRSPSPSPSPLPSEDLNPAESASPSAGSGQLPLTNQEPEKPSRPESADLLAYFCAAWVRTQRPDDGKPPTLTPADRGQASQLVKKYGLDACKGYVDRYLADPDKWLADKGYVLKHLTAKVDVYRSRASPSATTGHAKAAPHNTESRIRDDF